MKIKKYSRGLILTTTTALIFFACSGQSSQAEFALKNCINETVNQNIEEYYGQANFDILEFTLKAEKILMANGVIDDNTKKEYLELLQGIDTLSSKGGLKAYNQLQQLTDGYPFDYRLFKLLDGILNQCPYKIYKREGLTEKHLIYRQGKLLKELMDNGYYQEDLVEELFQQIDPNEFNKVLYRSPIVYLVLLNMDYHYDSNLIRRIDPSKIMGNE